MAKQPTWQVEEDRRGDVAEYKLCLPWGNVTIHQHIDHPGRWVLSCYKLDVRDHWLGRLGDEPRQLQRRAVQLLVTLLQQRLDSLTPLLAAAKKARR